MSDAAIKPGIMDVGRSIVRQNGVAGLYKGLPASLVGITPYIGIKMASFDILKSTAGVSRDSPNFMIANLLLGALAGTIAVTFTYPTDLLRRSMQMSGTAGYPVYSNIFEAASIIVKNEGPKGLYKGYGACLLKVAPSVAILFSCNEMLKTYLHI